VLSLSNASFFFSSKNRLTLLSLDRMKFGRQLEEAIYPEWQPYYISYNSLKADLRIASNNGVFTDKNETDFVEKLDKDLEKVKSNWATVWSTF
jgi:SPX domain protein involved in polyphosphate accumulation